MDLNIPQHTLFKLQAWRDMGETEVTGFFVTEKGDMRNVIDAIIIKAECSVATVDISAEAIENMYLSLAKKDIYPDQLQIWWHTHPGNSASPSHTDEKTFAELGQDRPLNIMYILASGGDEFAQISVTDIKSKIMLRSEINIKHPFTEWSTFPSYEELKKDYNDNVIRPVVNAYTYPTVINKYNNIYYDGYNNPKKFNNMQHKYGKHKAKEPDEIVNSSEDEIAKKLLKLTQEEIWYIDDLHKMVESGEITCDDADALAIQEGYHFGFYSDIYEEQISFDEPDTYKLLKTDADYIMLDEMWEAAATYPLFLTTVKTLIDEGKLSQVNANMYFVQNDFDVCYIDKKFITE